MRTRGIYFADEPANASDPVLNSIKNKKRRQTLIASPGMENGKTVYRFDIRLQETTKQFSLICEGGAGKLE